MSKESDEWAFDKARGLLDATGDEYRASTGFNNATEAMAAIKDKNIKNTLKATKKDK